MSVEKRLDDASACLENVYKDQDQLRIIHASLVKEFGVARCEFLLRHALDTKLKSEAGSPGISAPKLAEAVQAWDRNKVLL